jgi:hypothetical protein
MYDLFRYLTGQGDLPAHGGKEAWRGMQTMPLFINSNDNPMRRGRTAPVVVHYGLLSPISRSTHWRGPPFVICKGQGELEGDLPKDIRECQPVIEVTRLAFYVG